MVDYEKIEADANEEIDVLYKELKAIKKKIYQHVTVIRSLRGGRFDSRLHYIFKEVAPKQIIQNIERKKLRDEKKFKGEGNLDE